MSLAKYVILFLAVASSFFHWLGIVITGVIIGFMSESYRKAILGCMLFISLLWSVFLVYLATLGILEKISKFPLFYIGLLLSLAFAALSSTVRAIRQT